MGNLFPVSDRKNFIHRCFRAAAAEEALTNILRIRAVRRCLQNGVDRGADGGGVGFFELEARAKFGDTGGDAALFVRLREENERHAKVETLARTVHAAVGEEDVGFLQHGDLIDVWEGGDVVGKCAEGGTVDLLAGGEDDLIGRVRERGDTVRWWYLFMAVLGLLII